MSISISKVVTLKILEIKYKVKLNRLLTVSYICHQQDLEHSCDLL